MAMSHQHQHQHYVAFAASFCYFYMYIDINDILINITLDIVVAQRFEPNCVHIQGSFLQVDGSWSLAVSPVCFCVRSQQLMERFIDAN